MSIDEKVICLKQIEYRKINIDLSSEKHGDCRYCTPDYKNKNCSGYYPIKIYRMEVKNG